MTNHLHLVAVPKEEHSLGHGLRDTHTVYAMYFNSRTALAGHVWQGRFYSCPLDDAHLWAAVRYVERNPVVVGLADHAWDYAWSSARAHCGDASGNALLHLDDWRDRMPGETWREVLESFRDDDEAAGRIYRHTNTGRPLGSDSFLSRLEVVLGRRVRPLP